MKRFLLWASVVLVISRAPFVLFNDTAQGVSRAPAAPEAPPHLRPDELVHAYADNAIAAEQRFKGNRVVIQGTLSRVGIDIAGTPYLFLRSGEISVFEDVQALFSPDDQNTLAEMHKGQYVSVACTVVGHLTHVIANHCRLGL